MEPYRITKIYGITYSNREKELDMRVEGIHTMPLRKMEEMLYGVLKGTSANDPIVRLRIMTKRI